MTEIEWLESEQVPLMLTFLGTNASRRKLRLYACAVSRLHKSLTTDDTLPLLELNERIAEGATARSEVLLAWNEQRSSLLRCLDRATFNAVRDVFLAADVTAGAVSYLEQRVWLECDFGASEGNRLLAILLRDVFGNPFRPVAFDPALRCGDVLSLAEAAYELLQLPSGRFDPVRVSILADALEDAGCTDESVLEHCRRDGHVSGCWVVDLVLGKR